MDKGRDGERCELAPGRGGVGDDHRVDFAAGTVASLSGIGGTNAIEVGSPSGRYLMVHAVGYEGACCDWASIWKITVDATIGTVDPIILGRPVISEFMADNRRNCAFQRFGASGNRQPPPV